MRSSLIAALMVVPTFFLVRAGVEPLYAVLIVAGTTVGLALSVMVVLMWLTGKPSEIWAGVRIGFDEGLQPWQELWRRIRGKW